MAVHGRKKPDFSISISSAEDFDYCCDPCLTADQHTEAHGYCIDCNEYLCKNCFTYHQRTKALKDHQLLDKDRIDKQGIPKTPSGVVCTDKCQRHKDELIKFFCQQHEELCCHDCVALNHRSCNLDYIPEKCADLGDSDECKEVEQLLGEKMDDVNAVVKRATEKERGIDSCYEGLMKDIDNFQEQINNRVQQIRNEIQVTIGNKKASDRQNIQSVVDTCTYVSSDIRSLQSRLQDNKSSNQNAQLYIATKQALSKLKSVDIKKSEEELDKITQCKFEPNPGLKMILSSPEALGKLSFYTTPVTPLDLVCKGTIQVRHKSDKTTCSISGLAVLSFNKLVVADSKNNKLKELDTQRKLVVDQKIFDSSPFDVTVLSENNIAVTLQNKNEIHIMAYNHQLSLVRKILVGSFSRGLTSYQDHLYVICADQVVKIIDVNGDTRGSINLTKSALYFPSYVVLDKISNILYISDQSRNIIAGVTLQGKVTAVSNELQRPTGMLVLEDGSLLVCYCKSGSLRHLSANLDEGKEMADNLHQPLSIAYNHHQKEVYTGSLQNDQLTVFALK